MGSAVGDNGWYAPRLAGDPRTGMPAAITAPQIQGVDILAAPVTFLLRENGLVVPVLAVNRLASEAFSVVLSDRDLTMEIRYGTAGLPYIEWVVESKSGKTRNLSATFSVPLRPSADRAFFPAANNPRVALKRNGQPVNYSYGAGPGIRVSMPLGQVYSAKEDWGLAFFGQFGESIDDLTTSISRSEKNTLIAITLSLPRSASGKSSRRLYFAATRGDWRPALGAVLAQFPAAFEPRNTDIARLQGPFVSSIGTPPDADIQDWYAQGARVVEIHGTFPFYGEYVAQDKIWTPLSDDIWRSLKTSLPRTQGALTGASWQERKNFVEHRQAPSMTVSKVNDYIGRLHRHGMKGLIYINPTEAWAPWAAVNFASDRVLTAAGNPALVWDESVAMIPDKRRPWGQYLLEQVKGQLRDYAEVDGVFFDQANEGGHNLTELCAEACRLVRAQGKICWWNGPGNMELATLADGMMTEGGGSEAYRQETETIQYYGMAGKPIVSLSPPTAHGYAELLVHGVIPRPVNKAQHEIADRWFPLFTWLRNRRWVLEAHALDTTPGVQANLFRVPDDNLVVPVVPEPFPVDESSTLFDIGVIIRVPDAAGVRGIYLLSPDLRGYHKLPFVREGNELRITIPRLGVAGLLVLAKKGIFPALTGELNLVRGQEGMLHLAIDNWTTESKRVLLDVQSALVQKHVAGQVAADASLEMDVPVKIPANTSEPRLAIEASAKVDGEEMAGKSELWIDRPLQLTVEGSASVRDDEVYTFMVKLSGHLPHGKKISLQVDSSAWRFENDTQSVVLSPDGHAIVEFAGRAREAGKTKITITAGDGSQVSATAEMLVDVLATSIRPDGLERIQSAKLLLDVFGVDGGDYAHKPVTLNGVDLGDLPQGSGDQWTAGKVMPIPVEAIKALRQHNEISIDNKVGDAFKVRNLRLELRMRGGGTVASTTDAGVYTGGAGWSYAEGKQFPSGQSLTGIAVDIRFDASRSENYEAIFGVPRAARLVLEVNGSDGGAYAHKMISINQKPIGELPTSSGWARKSIVLNAAVVKSLGAVNDIVIENSTPPDAFKVRRAYLEVENTEGHKFASETEIKAFTSMGWDYSEGEVGSPIHFTLKFQRAVSEMPR